MKKQISVKRILTAALSLCLIACLASCGAAPVSDTETSENGGSTASSYKTVNLGYSGNNGCCDGLFGYVDVKGIIEEELNKVGYTAQSTGFSNGGAGVSEALASGAIDVGVYVDTGAIVGHAGGVAETVFAVNSSYTGIEIVTKDDSIKTISDLKGKKVAYQVGNVSHRFLVTALQSAGLSLDDIQSVVMTSAEGAAAIETGEIDALSAVEIYTGKLQLGDSAYHAVASTRTNPEWSSPFIVVGLDKFLKAEPDAAEAIVKALIRGKEQAVADPDDFYKTLADAHGFELDLQKYLEDVDNGTFDTKTIAITDDVIEMVRADYDFSLQNDLITNEFDVDAWFDNSFYEKASK